MKSFCNSLHVGENASIDLESFANHAGRSTIKTDDVTLLARRNEGLETIVKSAIERLKKAKEQEAMGT